MLGASVGPVFPMPAQDSRHAAFLRVSAAPCESKQDIPRGAGRLSGKPFPRAAICRMLMERGRHIEKGYLHDRDDQARAGDADGSF